MDNANGVLLPTPFWFDRIEFINRKSGEEISRYYGDNLMLLLTSVPTELSDSWALLCGYDTYAYGANGVVVNAGTTVERYLPLPANFVENLGLDMSMVDFDIEIRLHPRNGGPLEPSASAPGATPLLTELAGVYDEERPDAVSHRAHVQFRQKHLRVHNFLDSQQYVVTGRTLNPSTNYEFDLDQFMHSSACLVLCITPQVDPITLTTPLPGEFASLGDGSIDVLGVSGDSQLGAGRSIRADYLKNILVQKEWPSSYVGRKNQYIIPFSHITKALHGVIDGVQRFDGSKMRLAVTTPSNWVSGVYDVTIYSLYFRRIEQNNGSITVHDV
jgi:hypothetical protein